jgi:hypothetical protein
MERDLRIVPSDIVPAGTNAPRPSHRLAETADDVPAQLMQEFQDLWNDLFDYPDGRSPAEVTDEELTDSFACGYSPENATAFVLEFIRRVTGARPQ